MLTVPSQPKAIRSLVLARNKRDFLVRQQRYVGGRQSPLPTHRSTDEFQPPFAEPAEMNSPEINSDRVEEIVSSLRAEIWILFASHDV